MNDKLDEYRGTGDSDRVPEELKPDAEVSVPKGDEEHFTGNVEHRSAMNTLYDRSRRNREQLISRDHETSTDVELVERMVEEASGGESTGGEHLNTNRKGRYDEEHTEIDHQEPDHDIQAEHQEPEDHVDVAHGADTTLPEEQESPTVTVKIDGREQDVPRADVEDAGGIIAYQKSRAASIRMQRAATAERAAQEAYERLEQQRVSQETQDPSQDGQETDIKALRDELLDVVAEGSEQDIEAWVESKLTAKSKPKPETTQTISEAAAPVPTEARKELQRQWEEDRIAANAMMIEEYSDIMGDQEQMRVAQKRFNALAANPENVGRSQKEMAREAAEATRAWAKGLAHRYSQPVSEAETERRTRVTRKRKLPQPSKADHPAAAPQEQGNQIPSAREHIQRLRRRSGQTS